MFRPMAQVFCLAIIGAMLLGLTYVPAMASMLKIVSSKTTPLQKVLHLLAQKLELLLNWAFRHLSKVLSAALLLFMLSFMMFQSLGGEFVPTLNEGDLVIQPIIPTGTSLTKTIDITSEIEQILMTFPEVVQVVSRIGAAEVPTDPMSMEEPDVMVKLKPIAEWKTATTPEELITNLKQALLKIPHVDYEFTQPIEMRFNELITGVRSDIAVKIFGEDLNLLAQKADELYQVIQDIPGIGDISIEKTEGLPQFLVQYDRKKMAQLGITIDQANELINAGFGGENVGVVYEKERQFDLNLRFQSDARSSLSALKKVAVKGAEGQMIPLEAFAHISEKLGPAKISRDDRKRRIVIAVNVRDVDLETMVEAIQQKVAEDFDLPMGYSLAYGGQFENLEAAKRRLSIAIPIALALIFVLLYFAVGTVKKATVIYAAIPFASVGGVISLFVRDMPFSISAGVGFIALFGIAVLNGLVLIEEISARLKSKPYSIQLLIDACKSRLRPVLLTAAAAAFGFLPMAISTSAGAEIQRPLATVVIGGLVSSTILTLIVLPLLFHLFHRKEKGNFSLTAFIPVLFGLFGTLNLQAQDSLGFQEAVVLAKKGNLQLRLQQIEVSQQQLAEKTAFHPANTNFNYSFDPNNIAVFDDPLFPEGLPLHTFGIQQELEWPALYRKKKQSLQSRTVLSMAELMQSEKIIEFQLASAFSTYTLNHSLLQQYQQIVATYKSALAVSQRKFEMGEINQPQFDRIQSEFFGFNAKLLNAERALITLQTSIHQICNDSLNRPISKLAWEDLPDQSSMAGKIKLDAELANAKSDFELAQQSLAPTFSIGVFSGLNWQQTSKTWNGVQTGINLPLFYGAKKAQIKVARQDILKEEIKLQQYQMDCERYEAQLLEELLQVEKMIEQLQDQPRKEHLFLQSIQAYQKGESTAEELIYSLSSALSIRETQIRLSNQKLQLIIQLKYLRDVL